MSYIPSPPNSLPDVERLAYVTGEKDPIAAREAWYTTDNMLDYRSVHQGDRPYLCLLNFDEDNYTEYTLGQCARWVRQAARRLASHLGIREAGQEPIVIAMMSDTWLDYWINMMAISRL